MGFVSKRFFLIILLFLAFNGTLFLVWSKGQTKDVSADFFKNSNLNFKEISDFFTKLARDKGAAYAYDVLKSAPIPPGMDLHLLGHVVGDELYKQEGLKGMYRCTQDFRNACSHAIVVGFLYDKGEKALPEIAQACRQAPGGSGAYTMCFHGLGHGVLAYFDYDLEKAVQMCEKTGTAEGAQCIGGAIMEIIGGGFHNRVAWEKQNKVYLKTNDPLYPCNSSLIPESAKTFCYIYLTPHLFVAAGADLGNPGPENYKKAFTFCNKLSNAYAAPCYGGFGKEFVVLAKDRDIRNISNMNDQELGKVQDWCALADKKEGVKHCLFTALSSIFWGGENDPKTSVRYCTIMKDKDLQSECIDQLISQVSYYFKNNSEKIISFCGLLPSGAKEKCLPKIGQ